MLKYISIVRDPSYPAAALSCSPQAETPPRQDLNICSPSPQQQGAEHQALLAALAAGGIGGNAMYGGSDGNPMHHLNLQHLLLQQQQQQQLGLPLGDAFGRVGELQVG